MSGPNRSWRGIEGAEVRQRRKQWVTCGLWRILRKQQKETMCIRTLTLKKIEISSVEKGKRISPSDLSLVTLACAGKFSYNNNRVKYPNMGMVGRCCLAVPVLPPAGPEAPSGKWNA